MWWILLALALSLVEGCPKDVMRQVRHCMNPLEDATDASIFMFMSSLDKTSRLCREGKIQYAFSCLNDLYNKCAKSREGTQHFDLLVDVGRWQQAMENICNNIHYLQDHADCESQANQEYKPCADQEVSVFSHELSSMWNELSSQGEMTEDQRIEAIMDAGCSFTVKILECLRTPFEKFCPPKLTTLLVTTVEDFMPPACAKRALIHSIYKIPKYKNTNYEKFDLHKDNYSVRIEAVVATSQPVPSENEDLLDNTAAEYSQGDEFKVNSPSPENDETKELIGSQVSSEMKADNGKHRMFAPSCATILVLVVLGSICLPL